MQIVFYLKMIGSREELPRIFPYANCFSLRSGNENKLNHSNSAE